MAGSGLLLSLNVKTFHVVLLCMMILTPASLQADMITCRQVVSNLTPCIDYLLKGGQVPARCCGGVKTLYGAASTTANRQSICKCLRSALNGVSYNNQNVKNAQSLPSKCGVDVPYAYKVTPQTKCEQ
ncbi:unnamed protein product [Rhodiola kirilowii]